MQNAMRRMCALKKIFYGAFLFHILNLGVVDIFFEKANLPGCGTVNALCGAELADEFIEFSLVLLMLLANSTDKKLPALHGTIQAKVRVKTSTDRGYSKASNKG